MPDPTDVTRRAALGRLGAAGLGAVAPAEAAPRPAGPAKYILGYGSLIQGESRRRTTPSAFAAAPVFARGISRGWYFQEETAGLSPTYLGAVDDKKATLNGVIYPVTDVEYAAIAAREAGYLPTRIDRAALTMLDGSPAVPDGEFWYFASKTTATTASAVHPIVQSYVDICVDGCLEIEALYPLAKKAGFAEQFVRTCTDWKLPWINDRLYPWRPFVHMPRAAEIDVLLRKVLGDDLFGKIKLP